MQFNTENPGVWFFFDDENEEKGGLCLRVLSLAETTQLEKKFKKIKIEYKRNNRFEVPIVDEEGYDKAMWDKVITDWKNVCDTAGEEVACTVENKYNLMTRSVAFATFVADKTEILSNRIKVDTENQEKNC